MQTLYLCTIIKAKKNTLPGSGNVIFTKIIYYKKQSEQINETI